MMRHLSRVNWSSMIGGGRDLLVRRAGNRLARPGQYAGRSGRKALRVRFPAFQATSTASAPIR